MKRTLFASVLLLCFLSVVSAQYTVGRPRRVATLPGGACSERDFIQTVDTKLTYVCQNAAWVLLATGQAVGTSATPQFSSLGVGQAAGANVGSVKMGLNVASTDGLIAKNSNSGGNAIAQAQNDGNLSTTVQSNGSAVANTTYLNKVSTGLLYSNQTNGLAVISSNASAAMQFVTAGFAFTNERMRITSAGDIQHLSGGFFGWTSTGDSSGTVDTTISRSAAGIVRAGTTAANSSGTFKALAYTTDTNCTDSAGAAACGSATAGSVVLDAAATTVVVSTTSVTANSQIFVQEDSSLGARLSVTCNTTTGRDWTISARSAGTSFTITSSAAPVTNPACLSYHIVN